MTSVKSSILAGLAFAVLFGVFLATRFTLDYALVAGPVSGLLFGAAMYFFVTSKTVKKQTEIKTADGETVIRSAPANHFMNGEAVGGKLYLLKDKLQFKSHGFNIQNHEFAIDIKEISDVSFYNVTGLIPTGLAISTTAGKTEKFVLGGRKHWKEEIEKLKNTV